MRRREFVTLLGGIAIVWPVRARAQQHSGGTPRIGVLMNLAADDPESSIRIAALLGGLQELGWIDGQNLKIEYRWPATDVASVRERAAELVALAPNVILASGTPAVAALQQINRIVPVVFVNTIDPVGAGFVESLARPGGNITGFTGFDYTLSGKWLEMLKQIAPRTTRVAVVRDASGAAGIGQFAVIQAAATSYGIDLRVSDPRDANGMERAIIAVARESNGGLIVTASISAVRIRNQIVSLAAEHRLPAVYFARYFVTSGGLISYGPDLSDGYRRAATYLDRILKGEKPADLPVQAPTRYELSINLKTAKSLGITIPPSLLATADDVIE
jgi:putative tryptophan/tyrosine transport system substrate-binding protein